VPCYSSLWRKQQIPLSWKVACYIRAVTVTPNLRTGFKFCGKCGLILGLELPFGLPCLCVFSFLFPLGSQCLSCGLFSIFTFLFLCAFQLSYHLFFDSICSSISSGYRVFFFVTVTLIHGVKWKMLIIHHFAPPPNVYILMSLYICTHDIIITSKVLNISLTSKKFLLLFLWVFLKDA
jgi:hypothetical protein